MAEVAIDSIGRLKAACDSELVAVIFVVVIALILALAGTIVAWAGERVEYVEAYSVHECEA